MRIPEKTIKDTFAKAHLHLDVIGTALEAMESAVQAGDYPNASKAHTDAYTMAANDLNELMVEDLAGFVDAVNPEIIAENEQDAVLERVKEDLSRIGSALVVLKDAVQHARPRKQGTTLDDGELSDQVAFIDDLKWKCWNAADAVRTPKHWERVLSEMEEIRSQLGVLANGYDVNSDADRCIHCESLRSTAERAYVSFKAIAEDHS